MPSFRDFERVYVHDRSGWRAWLAANHSTSPGIWLIYYKKESGKPRVQYDEAVEEALCYGWIDSLPNKLDDERYMQLFTPRKSKSTWSKLNKQRVERLIAEGLMTPYGLAKIEIARANGTWTVLDEIEELIVPPDLREALHAVPQAEANFEAFSISVRKGILSWISGARRPETRAERVARTARMAAVNKRAQFDRE
jgi:uncharacterized protein YdeI (YjbR/CyaY-like superfamily)